MTAEFNSFEKYEFPGMEPELLPPLSPEYQRIYVVCSKSTVFYSKSRGGKDLEVVPFSGFDELVPNRNNKMEPLLINAGVQKT